MLKILPGVMAGVPLAFIRAWSRAAWLYVAAYDEGLVDYLETRNLKEWEKHREATVRGDAVVEAMGAVRTAEEKRAAEARAWELHKNAEHFPRVRRNEFSRSGRRSAPRRSTERRTRQRSTERRTRQRTIRSVVCVRVRLRLHLCLRFWWCFMLSLRESLCWVLFHVGLCSVGIPGHLYILRSMYDV